MEPIEYPINGILDLHAFRPNEVADVVEEYLRACREKGILRVRIIHGKGIGMLRRTVHHKLDRLEMVADYHLDGEGPGSWGATIVHLRSAG